MGECGVGVGCGDLRIQCWNVNSMRKSEKSWSQFINKMRAATEEIFIVVDTRFESEHEFEFKKLWDGPIFFNSYNSIQRGIMAVVKETFVGKELNFETILRGNYSRLNFTMRGFKVLIKCCYAPNRDMASFGSDIEGESDVFFKTVFDDKDDTEYDVAITAGDFNVAPDHKVDTLGYLHVNNPNSRFFINKMKSLNMITDVFRHKHPDAQRFTFSKKQTRNHTKARLDYFLVNNDALDLVSKVGMGRENTLSDHCPIFLHFNLTKIKKGRGFWRLNSDFLHEPEFIFGVNQLMGRVIEQYSDACSEGTSQEPEPTPRPLLISFSLLHDVILLESRGFALRYAADQKRRMLKTKSEYCRKIDEKANSVEDEDIKEVNFLKQEMQNLEEERDMAIARKSPC